MNPAWAILGNVEEPKSRYSWENYRSWDDDKRWELIDGVPYLMSSPRTLHQEVVGTFHIAMAAALRGKPCRVYLSPLDVRLSDWDVVQPDLLVVCDRRQITPTHIEGPPILVVEVLSPSSQRHDRVRKLGVYARFGISEYWIVSVSPPMLEVLVLDGETYRTVAAHTEVGRVKSPTVPDLDLDLAELFGPCDTSGLDEVREGRPRAYAG
ncbi:MAG: Uma2 family endonuclease [Armatimonadetes bacterium]|nr:Uma2 family endonuclease [Armatimonadota bacterium]